MISDPTDNWPFDQPRNCAVFTTLQILRRVEPILLVSHDADDHGWQFIGGSPAVTADLQIVGLGEMVRLDPTILEVADIPPGWQALRDTADGPWLRRVHPAIAGQGR